MGKRRRYNNLRKKQKWHKKILRSQSSTDFHGTKVDGMRAYTVHESSHSTTKSPNTRDDATRPRNRVQKRFFLQPRKLEKLGSEMNFF